MSDLKNEKKKVGRYRYLAGNIALFSISNFVSKILVFLLVPLYTGVLSEKEYGIADILQVTLLLLVPALTQNIGEAALRFGIDRADKRKSILKIGLKYVGLADMIVAMAAAFAGLVLVHGEYRLYILLFVFLYVANSLYEFLILYFQGSEKVPIVVIGSVSSTAIMIGCNLLFLLVFKIGLNGYIFSQVAAFVFASIVMLTLGKMSEKEDASDAGVTTEEGSATANDGSLAANEEGSDKDFEKEMLTYSRPMLLYSTAAWVNNASDRYIVAWLCGAAVNGVYGVAYKIPAILSVFQRVFAQAWQMSATKTYKDENSSEFFSGMYRFYNSFMILGCSLLILLVRPIAMLLFQKGFYEAWTFVPPLLISVIFGALTGFLGSICLAHKDSKSMGIATGIGAATNVVLNIVSIPFMGAMGAAWATAISYFIMCMLAYKFTSRHVAITREAKKDYPAYVILVIEAVVMIAGEKLLGAAVTYVICALTTVAVFVMYRSDVKLILKNISEIIGRYRNKENK